jgi:transcriptional regulator
MYVPAHFAENRQEVLFDLIENNPLGILITNTASVLDANHIPFELARSESAMGVLHCHVARANPVWQEVKNGDDVLVIFRSAEAYISPQFYPSKFETHEQVPSWNYMVVHARGRVTIRDDDRYIRGIVAKLTKRHEAPMPTPWKMSDSSREFIASKVAAIVGIEIEITELVGKFKLSQNKELRDVKAAGEALIATDHGDIGEAMLAAAREIVAKSPT